MEARAANLLRTLMGPVTPSRLAGWFMPGELLRSHSLKRRALQQEIYPLSGATLDAAPEFGEDTDGGRLPWRRQIAQRGGRRMAERHRDGPDLREDSPDIATPRSCRMAASVAARPQRSAGNPRRRHRPGCALRCTAIYRKGSAASPRRQPPVGDAAVPGPGERSCLATSLTSTS